MDHEESGRDRRAGVTSATLLARMRNQEPEAWRSMVQLYGPLVRHWCRSRGAGPSDLDDLSQEVFRVAATRLVDFRRDREGDSFRGWLRGIVRNLMLKHHSRRVQGPQAAGGTDAWKALEGHADPAAADSDEPASPAEAQSERAAVYARLLEIARSRFEDKTWQAFYLTTVEERPTDEVAAQLGLTAVAVRKYKSRVLQLLRREYGELLE